MTSSSPFSGKPWLSSYPAAVPHEIGDVVQTLPEMLAESVRSFSRHTALEFFGADTSYGELGELVDRAAKGLWDLGVRKGDRVALVLPNCPQHVVAFYAVLRLGAVVVEHNPLYTERELRHQFEDHGATVAIVWNKVRDTVAEASRDLGVRYVIEVDMTHAMPRGQRMALRLPIKQAREARAKLTETRRGKGTIPWKKLIDNRRISKKVRGPEITDVALLQYTSGTTGTPKGAVLTHRNLRANAMQGRAWVPGLDEGSETFYGVLPFFHAYGLTLCMTFAMSLGCRLVLFPTFDVGLVTKAAKKSPPTFLPAVPPIYEHLSREARQGNIDLSTVKFAISGAMSLPVATVDRWEKVTGGLLVEGYGMTESSPVAVGNPMGPTRRPGTVGVPFPSTEIRVVDPEDPSTDVAVGEAGELLLRGPQVFDGYWNRPEDTAATLLPEGWLRTGDIVTVSEDGFVTISDRLKELIITGGFNVSPSEVEEVLLTHPDIEEAAVAALPREDGGEMVAASVVLRESASQNEVAIRDFCRKHLTAYKVPRRVDIVDELPRSLIGKVLRREVQQRMLAKTEESS